MIQSIKIYKVNQEIFHFQELKNHREIINFIIKKVLIKYKSKRRIDIAEIPFLTKDSIDYYLFVHNFAEKQSEWNNFFPNALTDGLEFSLTHLSLILFIDNGIDIFLVVGGKAYQSIVPFIDHSFGLGILSRILTPNEDTIISINSREITGSRAGLTEQYSSDFKIADFVRFGKVPKEVHLITSKNISNTFFSHIQKQKNEQIRLYAGKSFKIKKSLEFELLHETIIQVSTILATRKPSDYLSPYIEVKDYNLIEKDLKPMLIRKLYNDLEFIEKTVDSKDKRFKFDLCNPNKIVEFYEADYYILKEKIGEKKYSEFARVEQRSDIYVAAMRRTLEEVGNNDYFEFRRFISGIQLLAYSDSQKSPAKASFIFHFTAEFPDFNGKPVFLVDTKWYLLNPSFINDLRFECIQTIKNHKLPEKILDIPWDKSKTRKESEYNLKYQGRDNYIVLDTFTPDGIEICDILYLAEDRIYLIHVKYGFDASLRELSNQVTLSSRRVYEDVKSGEFKYIDAIYKYAKKRTKLTNEEFRKLFKGKIVYVFAFASQLVGAPLVEDEIEKYSSNIAKYSLIQCNKDLQTSNYELNIHQISRT